MDLNTQKAESNERPVVFMCPKCFERGAWPLDPDCSTCAGTGVVRRETFDRFLASRNAGTDVRDTVISCDACHKVLTDRNHLELRSNAIFNDRHSAELIARDYHFCNLACVDRWRDEERRPI